MGRILIRIGKITGITVGSILLLMFLLPYLFPGFVSSKIKQWAKNSVNSELNFSRARLSFFRHFPSLTLSLHDLTLKGSAPFEKDTLIHSDEIALGIDLSSLFSSTININKVFLTDAYINLQVNEQGVANYNVYKSKNTSAKTHDTDSGSASLKIEQILIEKSHLEYNDRSLPMHINAKGVFYEGTGDLSKAIFDLKTHTEMESVDFYYNNLPYFLSKKINADLVTKINTNSLALTFEKNELTLNKLPLQFKGAFEVLDDGYNMDFNLQSNKANLSDMFSALPPGMLEWLKKTAVKGTGDIDATLKGKYSSATNTMPDFWLKMAVQDGYIGYNNTPEPISNLSLRFNTVFPGFNTDSLRVNVDTLQFNIGKDLAVASLKLKGLAEPDIDAHVNAAIDLEKWSKAIGMEGLLLKGNYTLNMLAKGKYAKKVVTGFRRTDTVIASIPMFTIKSSLQNGYVKYASLPQSVNNISFNLDASCPDHDYRHTRVALENINANVLDNFIKGYFKIENAANFPVEGKLQSVFNLADVSKFYPLDSMQLAGALNVNVETKGNYLPAKKILPVTHAHLKVEDGTLQTAYYPNPLEHIQVTADITTDKGSYKDLTVNLTPISFTFEGQPFYLKADLQNFTDLKYHVNSNGTLDIGKLYRVFARKGYDVKGFIETNLALRGTQSDATAGRYDKLFNAGTLKIRDVQFTAEQFPMPFLIKNGVFRFKQDKMWFDQFDLNYGSSKLKLNGYLYNVVDYAMDKGAPLKGSFELTSDYISVDEFTAFGGSSSGSSPAGTPANNSSQTGVVMVPPNLSLEIKATVKKVQYNELPIKDCHGQLVIDSGGIALHQTGFSLIDAPVEMDATYKNLSPQKAVFTYHIVAKEFDVKRAYNEIKLFHDLATSASKAEGIISLDYQLSGRLDGEMRPVYPSLKGGGVLSVKKVKMNGLKLFSAVSKETNKDVNDPDISKVDIKSAINNNLITIERTRMKVSVFRLRFEGQASFDGKLNLKFRVGLPPLGIIGIPMRISGTQENPVVKLGKGDKKGLEETEDVDEGEGQEQEK
ncbi:MAG: AsmA family protein [Chitinophagaceae bacterium]